METKTWAKLIIAVLLILTLSLALYFRWHSNELKLDSDWGKGNLTISERNFYIRRIGRIIDTWSQTAKKLDNETDGRIKDTYKNFLVIDLNKRALWIEGNGQMLKESYAELPLGLKWKFYYSTPKGNTELTGRTFLRFRGSHTGRLNPEFFCLVGQSHNSGHISFQFNGSTKVSDYGAGQFTLKPYQFRSIKNSEDLYGSLIVTGDEYQEYRNSVEGSNVIQSGEESTQSEIHSELEENKANWSRIEKRLYMEIDKQVRKAGYELYSLKVETGPDFSAGHAELRARRRGFLKRLFGGSGSVESYLQIDNIGNDIWYAKSGPNPRRPILSRRQLDLEFLIYLQGDTPMSWYHELIEQGRRKQRQLTSIPESKWKAELPNGIKVEFIGVCENPSAGKQWWGPDGSPLDFVPYINTEPYGRPREDRKIFEFAWRINQPGGVGAIRHSFEGSRGSYYRQMTDIYGNRKTGNFDAEGLGFDKSRQVTTWKVGFSQCDWQTALIVKDKAAEANFLGKQRIILNPPVIEDGLIVVRCYEDYRSRTREYNTDFGLIVFEDLSIKTVSLDRYPENIKNDETAGLTEHIYTIEDLSMSQIEGVCFRYRPYKFVTFKNISLVPGKNMGFSIESEE
jgi:hypothetical protein